MCGIPITRLTSPHTNESISPPPSDASNASTNATAALIAAVRSPSRMLKESPATVRFSISRPIQSVPNSPAGSRRQVFSRKIDLLCGILPDDSKHCHQNQEKEGNSQQPECFLSHALPPFLSLGSTSRYSPSAAAFPANTSTALMSVIPSRSGISLPSPAVTAACPSPG